jgi:hypothetical protein
VPLGRHAEVGVAEVRAGLPVARPNFSMTMNKISARLPTIPRCDIAYTPAYGHRSLKVTIVLKLKSVLDVRLQVSVDLLFSNHVQWVQ